ncbi:MAG: hypothetical protein Kow0063_09840 [Anaerolineae bacterium]
MMQVCQIKSIEQFDQLKTNWETVYSADPHAHIFVSWVWLRGWFEITPYPWLVLAVRKDDTSPYVAFFPLTIRALRIFGLSLIRVLRMGGRPLAYYTGFVCLPECEEEAMAALVAHVQQEMRWDSFQIEDMLDRRLDTFLARFPGKEFDIQRSNSMPSLYIPLPASWDSYLQDSLGSRTRKNLRRALKGIDEGAGLCMTSTQTDRVDRDIDILLMLWQQRWGPKPMAAWHRGLLRHLFENGCLFLNVLWNGAAPVAARAGLIDHHKKTFYGYIICHDEKYARLSPGTALVGHSIRYAIENGFRAYDFLVGADNHKLSFGAKQRSTQIAIIARKSLRSRVANALLNLIELVGDSLKKALGKIKRTRLARQIWSRVSAQFKRVRQ